MQTNSVEAYIEQLDPERRDAISKLRQTINQNLPEGFQEQISYGMIGWIVPKSTYPKGYHCNAELPLPFLSIASQKNFVAVYHMGIYSDQGLLDWFVTEFPKHSKLKLDMGKSCMRFKKPEAIPFELIGELVGKLTPNDWISLYESHFVK
ncbi:DUF1801 domain-containing protein [Flavobacterium selenitireducens]|uniref:DUF1801 domain-containing protein n=1 Tax=Flavobacterium selenitireducens TaxID=2722704 RepID=UPI00168BF48D|nr:DUF1801 domain-containing protein [Flavobacterium selenitireducens]MBD3581374.1 DUF1801 domain-containing protein [Flavobacterium selenitireducens]